MPALGRLLFAANRCDEDFPELAASRRHLPSSRYFLCETVNALMLNSVYSAGQVSEHTGTRRA